MLRSTGWPKACLVVLELANAWNLRAPMEAGAIKTTKAFRTMLMHGMGTPGAEGRLVVPEGEVTV